MHPPGYRPRAQKVSETATRGVVVDTILNVVCADCWALNRQHASLEIPTVAASLGFYLAAVCFPYRGERIQTAYWFDNCLGVGRWACFYFYDSYTPERHDSQVESYFRIFTWVGALALLLAAITYVFSVLSVGSRVLPTGLIILTAGLMGWRRIYYWLVCQSFLRERVYVLGGGDRTQTVLQSLSESGVEVVNSRDALDVLIFLQTIKVVLFGVTK